MLPFSREQFLAVFVAHNHALWPALLALWRRREHGTGGCFA